MSRPIAATLFATLLVALAVGSTPAHASGCAKVKSLTPTVGEAENYARFKIEADEVETPDPKPSMPSDPPVDEDPPVDSDPSMPSDPSSDPSSDPPAGDGGGSVDLDPGIRALGFSCKVHYTTVDGSAHAGEDYTPTSGKVDLDPGDDIIVNVPIVHDTGDEPDEDFSLSIGKKDDASATIVDDDEPAPPTTPTTPTTPSTPTTPTTPTEQPGGGGQSETPPGPPPAKPNDLTPPTIILSKPVEHAGGVVVWLLTCPATEESCSGTVRLTALGTTARRRAHASRRRAKPTIGVTSYTLRGGETKRVKVRLNKRGRKLLRKGKDVRARAAFETRDSSGNVATTSEILTLHAAPFRHS